MDKAQMDSTLPNLNQVVGLLKNYEARKTQHKEWTQNDEDKIFKATHRTPKFSNKSSQYK